MPATSFSPGSAAAQLTSTPTLTLSNTLIDQGQSILFTANVVVGQGSQPYSYSYNVYAYNITNNANYLIANMLFTGNMFTSNAWLWTPTSNMYVGNSVFIANVFVTDAEPVTVNSVSNTFGYNAALAVTTGSLGTLSTWQTTNSLTYNVLLNSCTSSNNYIYCPGGDISGQVSNSVQYAQILSTGALGAWQTTNALTFNAYADSCTSSNGYVYCAGGELASGTITNTVQYAQILSTGALGAWQTTNSLTFNVYLNSCTSSNGYIYCPGGYINGAYSSNVVQHAQVLGTGALGAWQTTNALVSNVYYNSCTSSNGYIYCPGGDMGSQASNIVQYAQVLGTGALGAWQTTNLLSSSIYENSCTSYSNYIYCPGGYLTSGTQSNTVQYASILGTGALGAWQTTNALSFNVYKNSCTALDGYVYCPGGNINNIASNTVQYAQVFLHQITISNTPAYQGQYESFNGSITGGTAPYNVFLYVANSVTQGTVVYTTNAYFSGTAWAFNGIQVPSNWVTNSPLVANILIKDSATTSTSANSINSPLNAIIAMTTPTLTISNTLIDQGQSILFTANIIAGQGTPPYNYAYNVYAYNITNNGNFLIANMLFTGNSFTSNAWLWTPNPNLYAGNSVFIANVLVTDAEPATVNSVSNTFGYNAALAVSVASLGTVSAWQTTNALVSNVYYNSCTSYNGYIYCPGGQVSGSPSGTVQYAQVLGTGALEPGRHQQTPFLTLLSSIPAPPPAATSTAPGDT